MDAPYVLAGPVLASSMDATAPWCGLGQVARAAAYPGRPKEGNKVTVRFVTFHLFLYLFSGGPGMRYVIPAILRYAVRDFI